MLRLARSCPSCQGVDRIGHGRHRPLGSLKTQSSLSLCKDLKVITAECEWGGGLSDGTGLSPCLGGGTWLERSTSPRPILPQLIPSGKAGSTSCPWNGSAFPMSTPGRTAVTGGKEHPGSGLG